jgi:hypothetical protein
MSARKKRSFLSKIETITAERLDGLVDEGTQDVLQYFDLDNARRGGPGTKRINIDLPNDFLTQLDREATRRGITRQSLIKVWLYDRLHSSGLEAQSIVDLFAALAKTQSIKNVGRLTKRPRSRPKS